MNNLFSKFDGKTTNIHQENEVILGNLLDASELPDLPIYHTVNKPVHFVMSVVLGLVFLAIGRFFSYEKADIAYYDKLINTLIQEYQKTHQIDKVPKMRFIRQR